MNKWLKLKLNLYYEKWYKYLEIILVKAKPLILYYQKLSVRERILLLALGVVAILFVLISVVGLLFGISDGLEDRYTQMQQYRFDARRISYEYKAISKTSPNQFSRVSSKRIESDMKQILGVASPSVSFADNNLIIKAEEINFANVMLFLDQMRKSYGLFPKKLRITRLARSGFVSFNATFMVNQNADD